MEDYLVQFKKQTISGLSKSGCNVIDIGLNPTPILYFGSHNLNADGAIQITGSIILKIIMVSK